MNKELIKQLAELSDISSGLGQLLQRFVETGCFSPENPNQNQEWCSCGKPFCYECVANRIAIHVQKRGYHKGKEK